MADDLPGLTPAPWLKGSQSDNKSEGSTLVQAPWLVAPVKPSEPEIGVAEDVAKSSASGLGTGVLSIPGFPGDLQHLAQAGVSHTGNPFDWLGQKFGETRLGKFIKEDMEKHPISMGARGDVPGSYVLPTTKELQGQVEKVTGPFHEPQTGYGRAAHIGASVAPMLAAGGEGLIGTGLKAVGSGATSELAGQGAAYSKGILPKSAQPYAEPVARAVGAVAGGFTPAGVRRAFTPSPMTNEQFATVNALRQTNPELVNASTAGQLTESPRIAALEARSPRMANLPQKQAEAYTQGVMRESGAAPGAMFDTPGLATVSGKLGPGGQLERLRNMYTMPPPEFQNLTQFGKSERLRIRPEVGQSPAFQRVQTEIAMDPTRINTPAVNMPGQRYGALKQKLTTEARNAPTTHESEAIYNVLDRMDKNFASGMPPAEAERLRQLNRQYSNYKTIENIPTKADQNTITPNQVFSASPRGTDLERHATQAGSIMHPLPKPSNEISPLTQQAAAIINALVHGGAGYHVGGAPVGLTGLGEGYLGGLFGAESAVNAAKNAAGRVVAHPWAQGYLANQFWRPGRNTSADPALLAKLLMTPPVTQAGK